MAAGSLATVGTTFSVGSTLAAEDASDETSSYEIWDLHGHLAGAAGKTPEDRMRKLLEYADRMHVKRTCVYMGMTFSYDPSREDLRKQNDEVLQALRVAGDRALGFVYLNPKHLDASLDELKRCVADGPMVGVKLWVATHANEPNVDKIVEQAAQLEAVIFQHTWLKVNGNLAGESTPMHLAELASRHPNAKLICGHAGGDWEIGIRAVRAQQHVTIDLGGGEPTAGFTEMAVRELGVERILYGSDVPGRSYGTQLAKVLGTDLSRSHKQLILAGNLKRLLGPIMKKKGITQ